MQDFKLSNDEEDSEIAAAIARLKIAQHKRRSLDNKTRKIKAAEKSTPTLPNIFDRSTSTQDRVYDARNQQDYQDALKKLEDVKNNIKKTFKEYYVVSQSQKN